MVDVLSWLQTDHGYYGESDLLSSEASSSPSGSYTGKYLPLVSSDDREKEGSVGSEQDCVPKVSTLVSAPLSVKDEQGVSDPLTERNRKNAEAARLNRQKKKQYVQSIESEVESLRGKNKKLKTQCVSYESAFKRLTQEVEYLRSVIQNQSTLSTLLQNIPNTGGVRLQSSLPRKRSPIDNGYCGDSSVTKKPSGVSGGYSGGVCLHVAKDNVCIEFCSHCSKNAAQ
jgi:hypothetical protein